MGLVFLDLSLSNRNWMVLHFVGEHKSPHTLILDNKAHVFVCGVLLLFYVFFLYLKQKNYKKVDHNGKKILNQLSLLISE